jgi:hypothetical protein
MGKYLAVSDQWLMLKENHSIPLDDQDFKTGRLKQSSHARPTAFLQQTGISSCIERAVSNKTIRFNLAGSV